MRLFTKRNTGGLDSRGSMGRDEPVIDGNAADEESWRQILFKFGRKDL